MQKRESQKSYFEIHAKLCGFHRQNGNLSSKMFSLFPYSAYVKYSNDCVFNENSYIVVSWLDKKEKY
jgi:hypothetical protein